MSRSNPNLTVRESDCLREFEAFLRDHGRSPTYRELAKALGVTHVTAFGLVGGLIRKGKIIRHANKERGLVLIGSSPAIDLARWAREVAPLLQQAGHVLHADRGQRLAAAVN